MRNVKELLAFCDSEFAKLGITRYAALKKMGLSGTLFTEGAKRERYFSVETLVKIAGFIGVSMDVLLGLKTPEPQPDVPYDIKQIMKNKEITELAVKMLKMNKSDLPHIKVLIDSFTSPYSFKVEGEMFASEEEAEAMVAEKFGGYSADK